MFTREEYPQRLADIGLTKEQIDKLNAVLEEMMAVPSRTANKLDGEAYPRLQRYFYGKADGINAVYRFLNGDMDAHDEFEDK